MVFKHERGGGPVGHVCVSCTLPPALHEPVIVVLTDCTCPQPVRRLSFSSTRTLCYLYVRRRLFAPVALRTRCPPIVVRDEGALWGAHVAPRPVSVSSWVGGGVRPDSHGSPPLPPGTIGVATPRPRPSCPLQRPPGASVARGGRRPLLFSVLERHAPCRRAARAARASAGSIGGVTVVDARRRVRGSCWPRRVPTGTPGWPPR